MYINKSLVPCFRARLPPADRAIEPGVMGSVQALQVSAKLGGTQGKKAAKTVKKTIKQNVGKAKSTAKQSKNKAVTKSGASNWYGPDRPKFLGMFCSAPFQSFYGVLTPTSCHRPLHFTSFIPFWRVCWRLRMGHSWSVSRPHHI